MRACALAVLLAAAPALAGAPVAIVVAPAGECAGEERWLAAAVFPKAPESAGAPGLGVAHLTPENVAASATLAGAPLPELPALAGPGACDNPGSGCTLGEAVDDPDPDGSCGLPGSACP